MTFQLNLNFNSIQNNCIAKRRKFFIHELMYMIVLNIVIQYGSKPFSNKNPVKH